MSIVDDFVENLVERNALRLNGALAVQLVDGGIRISGSLVSVLRDQKKNKELLQINIPVVANVKVGEIVVPLRNNR